MRHLAHLYSPSIVLLLWAGYLTVFGRSLIVGVTGLVGLAITLALHFHAERNELR